MKDILSWSCVIGFFFKLAYKIVVRINLSTHALFFLIVFEVILKVMFQH